MAAAETINHDIIHLKKTIDGLQNVFKDLINQMTQAEKGGKGVAKTMSLLDTKMNLNSKSVRSLGAGYELLDGNLFSFAAKLPGVLKTIGLTTVSFGALKFKIKGLLSEAFSLNQQISQLADGLTFLSSAGSGVNIQFAAYEGSKGSMGQVTSALRALDTMGIITKSTLIELGREFATLEQATGVSSDTFTKVGGGMIKFFNSTNKEAIQATNAFINMGFSAGQLSETLENAGQLMEKLGTLTKMSGKAGLEFNQNYAAAVKTLNQFGVTAKNANEFLGKLIDPDNFQESAKLMGQLGIPLEQYYKMLEGGEGAMEKFIEQSIVGVADLGTKLKDMPAMVRFNLSKTLGISPQMLSQMAGKSSAEVKALMAKNRRESENQKAAEEKKAQTKANAERLEYQFTLLKMKAMAPLMRFVSENIGTYMNLLSKFAGVTAKFYNLVVTRMKGPTENAMNIADKFIKFADKMMSVDTLEEFFMKLGESLATGVASILSTIAPSLIAGIGNFIVQMSNSIDKIMTSFANTLYKSAPMIADGLSKTLPVVFNVFFDKLLPALGVVFLEGSKLFVKGIIIGIGTAFSSTWKQITKGDWGSGILTGIGSIALSIGGAVLLWKTANGLWMAMKQIMNGGLNVARSSLNVLTQIRALLAKQSGIGGFESDLPGSRKGKGRVFRRGRGLKATKKAFGRRIAAARKLASRGGIGSNILKFGARGSAALAGIATAGIGAYNMFDESNQIASGERSRLEERTTVENTAGKALGATGGALTGALTGAQIGALGGPLGIAIGGVAGGIIGSIMGEQIGDWLTSSRKKSDNEKKREIDFFNQRFEILSKQEEEELKLLQTKKELTEWEKQRIKLLENRTFENNISDDRKRMMENLDSITDLMSPEKSIFRKFLETGSNIVPGGGLIARNILPDVAPDEEAWKKQIDSFSSMEDKSTIILATAMKAQEKEMEKLAEAFKDQFDISIEKAREMAEIQMASQKANNKLLENQLSLFAKAGIDQIEATRAIGDNIVKTAREQITSAEGRAEIQRLLAEKQLDVNNLSSEELRKIKAIGDAQKKIQELQLAIQEEEKGSTLFQRIFGNDKKKELEKELLNAQKEMAKVEEDTRKMIKDEHALKMKYMKGGIGFHEDQKKKKDEGPPILNIKAAIKDRYLDMSKASAFGR